jgi:hypothetical protein
MTLYNTIDMVQSSTWNLSIERTTWIIEIVLQQCHNCLDYTLCQIFALAIV